MAAPRVARGRTGKPDLRDPDGLVPAVVGEPSLPARHARTLLETPPGSDPSENPVSCQQRVGISPKCAAAIEEWIKDDRPKCSSPALFTNLIPGRYGRLSPTAVYDLIVALGKKAGIRKVRGKNKVHPHALRHTVFTEAGREVNRSGRGVETLIKFTRHKDPRVAQGYLDATDDSASSIGRAVASSLDTAL